MGNRHLLWKMVLCLALLVLLAGGVSCVVQPETRPRAWIDVPKEGTQVGVNTPVHVTFHAYAQDGVAEIALSVNGEEYTRKPAPQRGEQFIEITQEWVPSAAGVYELQVRAYDAKGEVSNPASIRVEVVPGATLRIATPTSELPRPVPAEPSPTPPDMPAEVDTATPTSTQVQPTAPAPSGTPVPPTNTPIPTSIARPTIVSFAANPPALEAGQCSRVSWAVEGIISAVWLDGEGVGDHDHRDRCPDQTTTYTLRAVGPGGETTESISVEVTQPPEDTEGPTIIGVQHSPQTATCSGSGTIDISAEVTDPSGVSSVELYCELLGGVAQPKGYCGDLARSGGNWGVTYDPTALGHCPTSTTPVTARFWIRATDDSARANESEWGPGSFTIFM